jgi:hypothetical protein
MRGRLRRGWGAPERACCLERWERCAQIGAFPLPSTSNDSVLLETLAPGGHTVQLGGVSGTTGTGLIEVYEVR